MQKRNGNKLYSFEEVYGKIMEDFEVKKERNDSIKVHQSTFLIILAGVSINLVLGDNGIIPKAKQATIISSKYLY